MRVLIAIAIGLIVTLGLGYGLISYQASTDYAAMAPRDDVTAGKKLVELVRARQFPAALAMVDPSIRHVDPALLDQLAGYFPKGDKFSVRVTGWKKSWSRPIGNRGTATDVSVIQMLYAYESGVGVLATITFNNLGGAHAIVAVNIVPMAAEALRASEFQVRGLDPKRMALLALAVALDVLAIAAFVLCLMGPEPSWSTRWLWAIFTLVGLVRIDVIWATGALIFLPISFMLPPATLSQVPIGSPWHLAFTIPVGALVYLSSRASRGWGSRAAES